MITLTDSIKLCRNSTIHFGKDVELEIDATNCKKMNFLEHVELQVNIEYRIRGDLEIYLTSPPGKCEIFSFDFSFASEIKK